MICLIFPFPPSVNHTWMRGSGKRLYTNQKVKDFHKEASLLIHQHRLTAPFEMLMGRLRVEIMLFAKDKRARDIDNYQKSVFDCCTKNQVWKDDSQIDELLIRRGAIDKENPRVVMCIRELDAA